MQKIARISQSPAIGSGIRVPAVPFWNSRDAKGNIFVSWTYGHVEEHCTGILSSLVNACSKETPGSEGACRFDDIPSHSLGLFLGILLSAG